jgi:hypothetical protein
MICHSPGLHQHEIPEHARRLPFLWIGQEDPGAARNPDKGNHCRQDRDVNRIDADEAVPEKDRKRLTVRTRQARQIDVADDEARQDEEKIDTEIAASNERQ